MELVEDIYNELEKIGVSGVPLIIGGIIPQDDATQLKAQGVAAVFTPKDVDMNAIMADMVNIIRVANGLEVFA
jgi:(2R)-ethylmalonyl-CoA mutase